MAGIMIQGNTSLANCHDGKRTKSDRTGRLVHAIESAIEVGRRTSSCLAARALPDAAAHESVVCMELDECGAPPDRLPAITS